MFLLQGAGRRRWRYGRQRDLALRAGLPLKILRRFTPAHDAVLGPGDMLYLPPSYAHDGVAIDPCMTYSIGFRAPATNELAVAFLDWLRDSLALDGRYADPDLRATREPARIGASMQRRCAGMLAAIRWDRADADRFLGSWLSEPKPSVFFTPPARPAIVRRIPRHGVSRRRAARHAHAAPLRRAAPLRQRRRVVVAHGGRRDAPANLPTPARCRRARSQPPRRPRCVSCTIGIDMATSTPTPPDATPARESRQETLATVREQVAALDDLVALAQHSIRVFDFDLSEMGWNSPARAERLAAFLRRSRSSKLEIIVHETRWLESSCPRLTALLKSFSDRITVYRTGAEAKGASDPLVIVDGRHFLHRFHVEQPRAALVIEDPHLARPLVNRFDEIWATGEPGLTGTVLGL